MALMSEYYVSKKPNMASKLRFALIELFDAFLVIVEHLPVKVILHRRVLLTCVANMTEQTEKVHLILVQAFRKPCN